MALIGDTLKKLIDAGMKDDAPSDLKELANRAENDSSHKKIQEYAKQKWTEKRKAVKEKDLEERNKKASNFASLLGNNRLG